MSRDPLRDEIRRAPPDSRTDRILRDTKTVEIDATSADSSRASEPRPPESPLRLYVEYL